MKGSRALSRWLVLVAALAIGAVLWHSTPLEDLLARESLERISDYLGKTAAPIVSVTVAYIVASLILFPVTVMIVLGALTLPPAQAIIAGIVGVAVSSCTGYLAGWILGPRRVEKFLGPLFAKVRDRIQKNAFLSVLIIRHLPLGPFTLVNVILGSMHINLASFVLSNGVSLLPTIITSAVLGGELRSWYALTF